MEDDDIIRIQADELIERLLKGNDEIMEKSPLEKREGDGDEDSDPPTEVKPPDLSEEHQISHEKDLDKTIKADIIEHGQSNNSQFERH